MSKLSGKVAIVTGGGTGIGLAIARRFAAEGAHVYITGRRQEVLDGAKASIGERVTAVAGDTANFDDLDRLFATVREEKGGVDILIANAAVAGVSPLEDTTPEDFDKIFNTNVRGPYFFVQKALPLLRDNGSIVLVGSIAGITGFETFGVYAATKAAVRSFSRTWANELRGRNIRVNTLSPGPVDTPMIDSTSKTQEERDQFREKFASIVPLGRIGRPEEIAAAALFLASDDSSFSTGIDLIADGGITQIK